MVSVDELLGAGRPTDGPVSFQNEDALPGRGEVECCRQAVVPGADHNDIEARHQELLPDMDGYVTGSETVHRAVIGPRCVRG